MIRLFLILFPLFSFSFPLGFKGENQTVPDYPVNVVVPFRALTSLGGGDHLIETGNKNVLINPSFQHSDISSGWVLTDATAAASSSSLDGRAIEVTLTADGGSICQTYTTGAAFDGVFVKAEAWIKSANSGVELCAQVNGDEKVCLDVLDTDQWTRYPLNFIAGTTSIGICVKGESSTDSFEMDLASLGVTDGEIGNILPTWREAVDLTSSGDFTAGKVLVTRIGDQVTVDVIETLTHSSSSGVASAVGAIPIWARPDSAKVNVNNIRPDTNYRIVSFDDGKIGCDYLNWSGSGVSRSSCPNTASISYNTNDSLGQPAQSISTQKAQRCEIIDVSADANFTAGEFKVCKDLMGKVTVEITKQLEHSSSFNVTTATVAVPEWARPSSTVLNLFEANAYLGRLGIFDSGLINIRYFNSSLGSDSRTTQSATGSISYLAADADTTQATIIGSFLASNMDGGIDAGRGTNLIWGSAWVAGDTETTNCGTSPCHIYNKVGKLSIDSVTRSAAGLYNANITNHDPNKTPYCFCQGRNSPRFCVTPNGPTGFSSVTLRTYTEASGTLSTLDSRFSITCIGERP